MLDQRAALPVPGAANALTARIVEDMGFDAVYVSGAAIANSFLGVPDIGLTSLSEVAAHVAAIREAVELPLIVDADTGFGGIANTWRTVRQLERSGADAIQLEDQTFPKRCGHFEGKGTVSADEMVDKIAAACSAREDTGLVIIARTDARAEYGLVEACRRANAYREAGADVLFVEAPESEAEIAEIATTVEGPLILNVVEGGVTPALPASRLRELGFSAVLFANHSLLATIGAVRRSLEALRADVPGTAPGSASWPERQALVRREWFADFETRHTDIGDKRVGVREPVGPRGR
ncbi:isocitrate lyase/PEP mutase family protein [Pseudonocardia sp. NPDC046786]|uniref:isocitrate lyase/PEP mutase family protein n=1 Tax=Pseudonocardia sp. NPDC046786 TaxID=3155471 RepID=UPI0034039F2B